MIGVSSSHTQGEILVLAMFDDVWISLMVSFLSSRRIICKRNFREPDLHVRYYNNHRVANINKHRTKI